MKHPLSALVLIPLLAGPVLAQDRPAPEAVLETTLVAMNDGVEVGGLIVDFLRREQITLRFETMNEPSRIVPASIGGPAVIVLSAALPRYPRVYAPQIARRAAELMYAGMLDSAERRYMIRSLEVRAWIELGGSPSTLPVLEPLNGYADKAAAARFSTWLSKDNQSALHAIGAETGTKTLPELEDAPEADNRAFVSFLMAESAWKRMYPAR